MIGCGEEIDNKNSVVDLSTLFLYNMVLFLYTILLLISRV